MGIKSDPASRINIPDPQHCRIQIHIVCTDPVYKQKKFKKNLISAVL
jgi:hypothetical protein